VVSERPKKRKEKGNKELQKEMGLQGPWMQKTIQLRTKNGSRGGKKILGWAKKGEFAVGGSPTLTT